MQKGIPPTYPSVVCVPELGHYVIKAAAPPENQHLLHPPQTWSPAVISHFKGKGANKDAGQENGILPENGT